MNTAHWARQRKTEIIHKKQQIMSKTHLLPKWAFRAALLIMLLSAVGMTKSLAQNITFADANVKALCVANWDTNDDGELSYAEAAAVTDLGEVFKNYSSHASFDELQYFTGLTFIGDDAFSYCGFTSVVLPNTATTIGNYAFYAGSLSAITFPASLTSIGWGAFYGCPLLSISLPASVTNINGAFGAHHCLESIIVEEGNTVYDSRDNCNAIIETSTNTLLLGCKNTVIPNTVVSIGGGAFMGSPTIETVTIPASVIDIHPTALSGCGNLSEITVSELNPVYDSRDNCNAIIETSTNKLLLGCKNTVIPNAVVSIGDASFAFSGIETVIIPELVTSIENYAFGGCYGIASITVLAEVPPTLVANAFEGVPKDIPVYVPCGTRSTYQAAEGWSEFTNIIGARITVTVNPANVGTISGAGTYECGETCTLTATAYEGSTFINWTENDEVVSTEAEYTFTVAGDRTLVANFDGSNIITFADANVKALCVANWDTNGDGELSYAEAAAVTDLGAVFQGADITTFDELQYFTGLTVIGGNAFSYCGFTSVVLPNTVTEIGGDAFNNSGLLSITIPASVTSIGWLPFWGIDCLETIIVEEGNTVYDSRDNCNALIETSTNKLVAGSKNTVIPNTVVSLEAHAFSYTKIETVTIPASITYINYTSFSRCGFLSEITVSESNPVYDSRDNCNAIIETSTNKLVAGSKTTVIPNTVTTIGSDAFWDRYNTGSYNITIPESVTSIEGNNFLGCYGIASITVLAEVPPTLGINAFGGVLKDIPVNVPCASIESYQNANGWFEFTNYIGVGQCSGMVTVTAEPEDYGTVSGGGFYEGSATCTVTATPNEGYYFLCWKEDGQWVSSQATYTFPVYRDRNLTAVFTIGAELVVNGDFEQGNVGFTSEYYYNYDLGPGQYYVDNNAHGYPGFGHGGTGNFMMIDGATEPGVVVWSEQISIVPNTYYDFSTWVCTLNPESRALLQFSINGTQVGDVFTAPSQTCTWEQFSAVWYSGNSSTATISILDLNTEYSGNDFGLDDISFREVLIPLYWTPDNIDYEENMSVTAVVEIDGVEQQNTMFELGAFSGEECRGSQMALYFEPTQRYLYQMTVFGEEGDEIAFRLYDHATNEELDLVAPEAIVFDAFGYGNLPNPIVLNFRHSYDITATVNLTEGGTVEGGGTYIHGETCTLTATPNDGYVFVHWTLDGEVVSTEAEYTFEVTGAGEYTAHFNLVQTTNFAQGWNWWSSYVELNGSYGLEALENGLDANGIFIKSQNDGYVSYSEELGWYGSLVELYNEQSYRVKANSACTVQLQGLPTNPDNYPVSLNSGWTWMGFPWSQSVSVESALQDFEPEANDLIKGRNAYTMYYNENGYSLWFGPLNSLEPGQGYVYYSNSGEVKTLTFNTNGGRSAQPNVTADDNFFRPEMGNYADNMTLTAVVDLNGAELRSEDYEVAAFCNGECRGSAKLAYFAPTDSYIAFLTLYGNAGDALEFALTDGTTTMASDDAVRFASDVCLGTLSEPYALHFGFLGVDSEAQTSVKVYPNPTQGVFSVEGAGIRRIEVFNAFGQAVYSEETSNETFRIDLSDKAAGVYMLRVVTESGVTNQQLIKE